MLCRRPATSLGGDGSDGDSDGGGALLGHHCCQSSYMYM